MTLERLTEIRRKLADANSPYHPPVVPDYRKDMADLLAFIDQLLEANDVFVVEGDEVSLETPDFWEAVSFAAKYGVPNVHKKTTVLSMASV